MGKRRRQATFRPGDHVVLLVRCDKLHLWSIPGTIGPDGTSIECGAVSAPGADDDPTCCPVCRQSFTVSYGVMEDTHWTEQTALARRAAEEEQELVPTLWS